MNFFGKKKVAAAPKIDVSAEAAGAIKNLRQETGKLEKRRLHLEAQVTEQDEKVRERVRAKDPKSAKMALVRRNNLTKQLDVLDNQMITLEAQVMNLEAQTTNLTAVNAMSKGLETQKLIAKAMEIEKVEEIFDDLAEIEQTGNEISDAFKMNAEQVQGEMDFDAEIERIEAEMLEEDLMKVKATATGPIAGKTPAVAEPAHAAPAAGAVSIQQEEKPGMSADEAKELAELQAQLQFA